MGTLPPTGGTRRPPIRESRGERRSRRLPTRTRSSNNWFPDTFFTAGIAGSTSSANANTTDDILYQKYRYGGTFSYAIPLPEPGSYTVTLKFSEPFKTAAGQRKFTLNSVQGST